MNNYKLMQITSKYIKLDCMLPSKLSTAAARQTPTLSMAEAHSACISCGLRVDTDPKELQKIFTNRRIVQSFCDFLVNFSIISYVFIHSVGLGRLLVTVAFFRCLVKSLESQKFGALVTIVSPSISSLSFWLPTCCKIPKKTGNIRKIHAKVQRTEWIGGYGISLFKKCSALQSDNPPTSRHDSNNNVEELSL